jgi:hypothetical protein
MIRHAAPQQSTLLLLHRAMALPLARTRAHARSRCSPAAR